MSKGSNRRQGTGYAAGWNRIFGHHAVGSSAAESPVFTGKITMPNQTCGNCRNWYAPESESGRCLNDAVLNMVVADGAFDFDTPADFSCSLWEAKV